MIGISSKVTRNNYRSLTKQGQKAAARRNLEVAKIAENIAHQLCPIDSGDLDSTIHVEQNKKTGSASVIAGGVAKSGRLVTYAVYVEWGPYNQPFITPAMEGAANWSRNNRSFAMYRSVRV